MLKMSGAPADDQRRDEGIRERLKPFRTRT
jgi:hypothetical protein